MRKQQLLSQWRKQAAGSIVAVGKGLPRRDKSSISACHWCMNRSKEKARKNAMVIEAIANSHNTDSKTGKQQRILVEFSGHRCGILSLKRTLVDLCGRGKTLSAEGGTRHTLFAGVRPRPFCA